MQNYTFCTSNTNLPRPTFCRASQINPLRPSFLTLEPKRRIHLKQVLSMVNRLFNESVSGISVEGSSFVDGAIMSSY